MPQLDFSTYPSQIFWLLVSLTVLYFLLSRLALPRIETVIRDRQDTISKDLDQAAEFKNRAEEAEASYEAALAAAYKKAEVISQQTRDKMKDDLDISMKKADEQMNLEMQQSQERIKKIEASAAENVKNISTDLIDNIINNVLHDINSNDDELSRYSQKYIACQKTDTRI